MVEPTESDIYHEEGLLIKRYGKRDVWLESGTMSHTGRYFSDREVVDIIRTLKAAINSKMPSRKLPDIVDQTDGVPPYWHSLLTEVEWLAEARGIKL